MCRKNWLPGVAVVGFGFIGWALIVEPEWVRTAGLDFWNAHRLEKEVQEHQVKAVHLEGELVEALDRVEGNCAITRDVAFGRITLAAGAEQFYAANHDLPGFLFALDSDFQGPTPIAKTAQLLMVRVQQDEGLSAADRMRAMSRMKAEYLVTFGVPVPAKPLTAAQLGIA